MKQYSGAIPGSREPSPSVSALTGFDPERKHALDYELIEWRFVPRSRRKGYMTRDFFVGTRRYHHFASGADERGVIRYGYHIGEMA